MINLSKIALLINLARVDGEISTEEVWYIVNIGKAHNIEESQVLEMLKSDHKEVFHDDMDNDERLNLLIMLIQLMKADGKLFKEEIRYCSKIASRLGYKEEVLFELMLSVTIGQLSVEDVNALKKKTQLFLK